MLLLYSVRFRLRGGSDARVSDILAEGADLVLENSKGSHLIFVLLDGWQFALSAELLSPLQKYKNQM